MKKTLMVSIAMLGVSGLALDLQGAGATFPAPLYQKYFSMYKAHRVNYQAIGSGGGQNQLLAQTVDFGASDEPMSDESMAKSPNKNPILHVPTSLGAVVAAYNLPGVETKLKFTGDVLGKIFAGKITKWNDAEIAKLNPKAKLPPLPITIVRRSDSSGTTFVFTDYLAKVSKDFDSMVGRSKSPNWPNTSLGGKGNDGVTATVKQTPGTIGYIELIYAKQNKLDYALIRNLAGQYVDASEASVTAAASGSKIPADTRVSITNSRTGYPISSFTWILVYQNQEYNKRNLEQAKALKDMLTWIVNDGQEYNEALGYSTLSAGAKSKALANIAKLRYNGKAF